MECRYPKYDVLSNLTKNITKNLKKQINKLDLESNEKKLKKIIENIILHEMIDS